MATMRPSTKPQRTRVTLSNSVSQPRVMNLACLDVSNSMKREYLHTCTEQEYEAAADMMEEGAEGEDGSSGPGQYPGAAYATHAAQQQLSPSTTGPMEPNAVTGQPQQQQQQQGMSMTQILETSMDWDPFGLSASMAFPSSFSFDTSNMR